MLITLCKHPVTCHLSNQFTLSSVRTDAETHFQKMGRPHSGCTAEEEEQLRCTTQCQVLNFISSLRLCAQLTLPAMMRAIGVFFLGYTSKSSFCWRLSIHFRQALKSWFFPWNEIVQMTQQNILAVLDDQDFHTSKVQGDLQALFAVVALYFALSMSCVSTRLGILWPCVKWQACEDVGI